MCVAFIKIHSDSLILAHNRDEFYDRPSESMQYHSGKEIYSGIDLKQGGTWFSLNIKGEFAFVTNIRKKSLYKDNMKSRGEIPQILLSKKNLESNNYNPFNAIKGSIDGVEYINSIDNQKVEITEEIFGISNSTLQSNWPKVQAGKEYFKELDLSLPTEVLKTEALGIMQNQNRYDFVPEETGYSEDEEKLLTPIFIQIPNYGTVSTTILIIRDEKVSIYEENYINKTFYIHTFNI